MMRKPGDQNRSVILVDFQNIQNLTGLRALGAKVACEMFIGVNQKIPGTQILELEHTDVTWHVVVQTYKNALDMRIAYRIGQIINDFDQIYVLSKDTGFESLSFINSLPGKEIKRIESLAASHFRAE